MELFPLYVNIIAVVAIVTGVALAAWWVVSLYSVRSRQEEADLQEIDLPGHIHETLSGVPSALIAFYVMIGVVMILYVLYILFGGITY
jgi:hypothetical protein